MKRIIPYEPYLVPIAKANRKKLNYTERIMWRILKAGNMMGYDFTRQKPILRYIVDFYCDELQLVIEVDGITHADDGKEAFNRQSEIEALGISFLRFNALDVLNTKDIVSRAIECWILEWEHQKKDNIK